MKNQLPLPNNQNIFYRNNYRRLFFLLTTLIIINLLLVAILIYLVTHIPKADTYSSFNEKTNRIYAVEEPLLSQKALLEWANQAAITIYNVDYLNYPKQQQLAATFFTPSGWSLFQTNFQKVLDTVIAQKLRVSSVVTGAPVISEQGLLLGNYSWKIRMPLLITFESASEPKYQRSLVTMVVTRVPTSMTPKGIAIAQFYLTENRAANLR